jgi:nucleoside-diphosphate-sugar epimerase
LETNGYCQDSQRVLVTGHAGYIGAVMVPLLKSLGHQVVGADTGFFEGCDFGKFAPGVAELRKDIRDVTEEDLKPFDAVIHLAALCNDPLGDLNPKVTLDINYSASVQLARLARHAGVKRFLYSSSCSMYGAAGDDLVDEEASLNPLTAYAVSKVRAEEGISALASTDFSPIFMRNATAYGSSPRLRADVVINNLACWGFTTGGVYIMSDGSPWRPLVHVEDICRAFATALVVPREIVHNQAFNVGRDGENYRVRELADIVRDIIPGCSVVYAPKPSPDARNYRVDFSKVARLMPEFEPVWNARMGVRQLYLDFRRHGLQPADFQGRRFTRLAQLRFLIEQGHLEPELRWRTQHRRCWS